MRKLIYLLILLPFPLRASDSCQNTVSIPNPLIILFAGQSNCHFAQGTNTRSTTGHVTINRNYLVQADFYTPTAGDPIANSTMAVQLGDLIYNTYGVDVKIIMTSIGSTSSAQWAGGNTESYWMRIATNAVAFSPHLIFWNQGESDVALSVTQNQYYVNLSSVITNVRNFGVNTPFFVSINSSNVAPATYGDWYPNVRNAQYQVISEGKALGGPDTDVIRLNTANMDTVHFINQGSTQHALLWLGIVKSYYGRY